MKLLGIYIAIASLVSFIVMGFDKRMAKRHRRRVPEATLFSLAAIGGSPGILLGMYIFRHKTRHLSFRLGIPAVIIAQICLLIWLL